MHLAWDWIVTESGLESKFDASAALESRVPGHLPQGLEYKPWCLHAQRRDEIFTLRLVCCEDQSREVSVKVFVRNQMVSSHGWCFCFFFLLGILCWLYGDLELGMLAIRIWPCILGKESDRLEWKKKQEKMAPTSFSLVAWAAQSAPFLSSKRRQLPRSGGRVWGSHGIVCGMWWQASVCHCSLYFPGSRHIWK